MTENNTISPEKIELEVKKGEIIENRWWTELRHGGLLFSPAVLEEMFPNGPEKVKENKEKMHKVQEQIRALKKLRNKSNLDTLHENMLLNLEKAQKEIIENIKRLNDKLYG